MGSPHPLGVSTGPGWKLSPFVFIIFLPKIETIRLFIRDQYSHLPINTCNNVRHVLLHYRNKFSRRQNVHFQSVKSPHLPIQVEDLGGPDVALEAVRVTRGHRQDQQLWKKMARHGFGGCIAQRLHSCFSPSSHWLDFLCSQKIILRVLRFINGTG